MRKNYVPVISLVLIIFIFSSCNTPSNADIPPTPDVQATVNAAVEATATAEEALEATVESAVQATTSAATPYPTYTPYPTPTPVNIDVMTEEEIAALVDQEVQEAIAASEQAAASTTQAASDDVVTAEELAQLEQEIAYANQQLEEAITLADQYLALYYDLAEETIAILTEVEQVLSEAAAVNAEIAQTLFEISTGLQQGYQAAQETIELLESQALEIQDQINGVKGKAEGWFEKVQGELQRRTDVLDSLQPAQLAGNRQGALNQAAEYINSLKSALGDGKFSKGEMDSILQMGVNASASLRNNGGIGADQFAGMIDGINRNVARGEMPQIKSGLGNLEMSLPRR
jgi:hypothetical protein